MTYYDYKVVPAPRQIKRVKGVKSRDEMFCVTLAEAINTVARDGWEYLRAESLPATEEGGLFRRSAEVIETVLVFRRPRDTLGPRLGSQRTDAAPPPPEADGSLLGAMGRAPLGRPEPAPHRREPDLGAATEAPDAPRALPRLGPADPT